MTSVLAGGEAEAWGVTLTQHSPHPWAACSSGFTRTSSEGPWLGAGAPGHREEGPH